MPLSVPCHCSRRSLSRFASSSVSVPLPRWSLLCFYSRWIYDSIGSTLRPRSISARRGARAPNGRTLEGAYQRDRRTSPGLVGASRIEKNETRRERNEEPSINFPDYIVPTCGGTLEILVACARLLPSLRVFSLSLATALKLFNCTARYFPTLVRLSRFLCTCQAEFKQT